MPDLRSQGSEYLAAVIPLMMQHYPMLRRNLPYTGIARRKRFGRRRWRKLRDLLGSGRTP